MRFVPMLPLLATLLFSPPALADDDPWMGDLTLTGGFVHYPDARWGPFDWQYSWGADLTMGRRSWPIRPLVTYVHHRAGGSDATASGVLRIRGKVAASVDDFGVGVRKSWTRGKWTPWFAAGVVRSFIAVDGSGTVSAFNVDLATTRINGSGQANGFFIYGGGAYDFGPVSAGVAVKGVMSSSVTILGQTVDTSSQLFELTLMFPF